ncbi:MAG TPA: SulP family inorganic anion transporter, partial [Amaricoccus sp.]|nr:SulP family inorganic anion transporter [Amaricoccus sp.]
MAAPTDRTRLGRLGALVVVAPALAALSVALNVSLAAIVYHGALAGFVDRGIALTLLGAAAMAVVGALACGYRGTVCQPQDAPAIVLALAAGAIAAGMADPASERSFATVAALVVVTSAASGAAAWLLGRLGLGFVARFIPFPVLGGFLAATGYLLVMGALGIAVGRQHHRTGEPPRQHERRHATRQPRKPARRVAVREQNRQVTDLEVPADGDPERAHHQQVAGGGEEA